MFYLRSSQFVALLFLITQAFGFVNFIQYSDGTYGWYWDGQVATMGDNDIKTQVQNAYRAMAADARNRGKNTPSVMAAVYLPSKDYLVLSSSIKGGRAGSTSAATANYCEGQHSHGNCAEMHALSTLEAARMSCDGGKVAAYGVRGDRLTFMQPCLDRNGRWGCSSFCKQERLKAITKRMRIEGTPSADVQDKRAVNQAVSDMVVGLAD